MSCNLNAVLSTTNGEESKLSKLLSDRLNGNKADFVKLYGTMIDPVFQAWFEKRENGFKVDVDTIDGRKISVLIRAANQFFDANHLRVGNERVNQTSRQALFENPDKERHAIAVLTNYYLRAEDLLMQKKIPRTKESIKNVLRASLKKHGRSNIDTLSEDQKNFVIQMLSVLDQSDALLDQVIRQPKVLQLSKHIRVLDLATTPDEDVNEKTDVNEVDDEIDPQDFTDSLGEKRNFRGTISKSVQRLFDTQKRIVGIETTDTGDYQYDNTTFSGIAETISFVDYYRSIRNNGDMRNIGAFIQSLDRIAHDIPDRLALVEIANKARANKSLAAILYNNFNQATVQRNEFRVDTYSKTVAIANQNSKPYLVLRNLMMNTLKNDLAIGLSVPFRLLNEANYLLRSGVPVAQVIDKIGGIYDYFGFGFGSTAVKSFMYNDDRFIVEDTKRLAAFISATTNLLTHIRESQTIEATNRATWKAAYAEYHRLHRLADDMGGEYTAKLPNTPEDLIKREDLAEPMTSKLLADIMNIATWLAPYSDVLTEYNSRNIEGQLVSDIIRPSFITQFFHRFTDKRATQKWVANKNLRQYTYSNIFRSWTGIPGISTMHNGDIVLNDNYDYLQLELFNGTNNQVLRDNASYMQMTPHDWDVTVIGEFQNRTTYSNPTKVASAKYFMKTPSDAGKNFVITSYRIATGGLIKSQVSASVNVNLDSEVKHSFGAHSRREGVKATNLIDAIKNGERTAMTRFARDPDKKKWHDLKVGDVVRFRDGGRNAYVRITKPLSALSRNTDPAVWSAKEGWSEDYYNSDVLPNIATAEQIEFVNIDYKETRVVNRGHAMHTALSNIIRQEIEDMKDAFEHIFELNAEGKLIYENDKFGGKPKPKMKRTKKELYKNFHYKGDILNAKGELTGNVFQFWNLLLDANSDEALANPNTWFTKTPEALWDFLYGGSNSISEYVDNYITVATDDAVEYYSKYREDVEGYSEDLIRDMYLNYVVQYANFNDLFDGNPKFHKDMPATIKRNKQVQASGIAYAAYDVNPLDASNDHITTLDVGGHTIEVNRSFKYATINNVERPSDNVGNVSRRLNMSDNTPSSIVSFIEDKFKADSVVDDGHSVITLEQAIARTYLAGEYEEYEELFIKLLNGETPSGREIDRYIQLQKNFYYDISYDSSLGLDVAVQIKNAELILVPQFIKGTAYEQMYEAMKRAGIGQLNTVEAEKASVTGVLDFFDKDGNTTPEILAKFEAELPAVIKTGDHAALYRQQETPQHMDDENKAGIQIVKTLLNNLPGEWGEDRRNRFFDLFTENITESFEDLAEDLGVEVDMDGNIQYNEDGELTEIDKHKFFQLVRDELARVGSDSNVMEYATVNEYGNPNMPTWMPNMRRKIQNIFQAMFTNNVTRQTLKGFHAAQAPNVGWHEYEHKFTQSKYEEKYGKLARKLEYHPAGSDYVEVMLPAWCKDWQGKEVTIADLEAAGLTDMIGYRIPTEGKQSIIKMKVVALLPDAMGSTIVVPDEFVAQTGADFDIDTIYGIYFESYMDRTQKPRKVKYYEASDDLEDRYIAYVTANVSRKIRKQNRIDVNDSYIRSLYDNYKQQVKNQSLNEELALGKRVEELIAQEHDKYVGLPADIRHIIDEVSRQYPATNSSVTKVEKGARFSDKIADYIKALQQVIADDTFTDINTKTAVLDAMAHYNQIADVIALQQSLSARQEGQVLEFFREAKYDYIKDTIMTSIKQSAEAAGMPTIEEFENIPVVKQNTRAARNNAILDNMLTIMADPTTAEENLMSSNFKDILDARDKLYDIIGETKRYININSPIGQADYRRQVMGGKTLKAISVKLDGFNSIANVAKISTSDEDGIKVAYPESMRDVLEEMYGKENILTHPVKEGFIIANHKNLAWSNTNRNTEGKLITVYSSETTALILDGVKAGGIKNVTVDTFDVYKLMVSMGIDYETATAFMLQPAITEIVNATDNNGIFNPNSRNAVAAARHSMLVEHVGGARNYTNSVNSMLDKMGWLSTDEDGRKHSTIEDIALDKDELMAHLNYKDTKDDLRYQLEILATYSKLKKVSDAISTHASVMNTDKTGAGQSIAEVDKTINKIETIRNGSNNILYSEAKGGIALIDAMFPSTDFNSISPQESAYPSLYAQLKYAMLGSKSINSTMFRTESGDFLEAKRYLPVKDEKTMFEYENYIITNAMNNTMFILDNSISYEGDDGKEYVDVSTENAHSTYQRIYGFAQGIVYEFDFADTSRENVEKFLALTPANKVMLLRKAVSGESIFDYIEPILIDARRYNKALHSPQTIRLNDSTADREKLFELFRDLYYKDNVFFKATAEDLIRYAVTVEGLQYKYNYITKIIPAEVLYNSPQEGGTGLINETESTLYEELAMEDSRNVDRIDRFFRSYPDNDFIPKYENKWRRDYPTGRIKFDVYGNNIAVVDADTAASLGILYENPDHANEWLVKPYVWTNPFVSGRSPKLRLYKTVLRQATSATSRSVKAGSDVIDDIVMEVVLFPVNRLEKNETGEVSVNPDNNIYETSDVVNKLLDASYGRPASQLTTYNLSAMSRARFNNNRAYVRIYQDNVPTLFEDYLHAVADGEMDKDGNLVPYDGKTMLGEDVTVVIRNFPGTAESVNNMNLLYTKHAKFIIVDNENAHTIIEKFEGIKSKTLPRTPNPYKNYIVVGQGSENTAFIDNLNREDKIAEMRARMKVLDNSLTTLDKSTGSYTQFLEMINNDTTVRTRIASDRAGYIVINTMMAEKLKLSDGGRSLINLPGGKEVVVSNLGVVNKTDYVFVDGFEKDQVTISAAVKDGFDFLRVKYGNLIRVEDPVQALNAMADDSFDSSVGETDLQLNRFISNTIASVNVMNRFGMTNVSRRVMNEMRALDVDKLNYDKLNDPTRVSALMSLTRYIEQETALLNKKANHFYSHDESNAYYKDPNAFDYAIDDSKLFDIMVDNETLQGEFSKTILDISNFINDNEQILKMELYDLSKAANDEERAYMTRANEYINTLHTQYDNISHLRNKTNKARELFFQKMISHLSNDPMIKSGMYDAMNPYKDETWFQLWATDNQESHIPLVKVILKKVIDNTRTAELDADDAEHKFRRAFEAIQKRHPGVSFKDVIDETGRLVLPYTQELIDTMRKNREHIQEVKAEFGENSIEYIKAKQAAAEWTARNVVQPYKREYYDGYSAIYHILDGHDAIRLRLAQISREQSDIMNRMLDNDYTTLTDENFKRLGELTKELAGFRTGEHDLILDENDQLMMKNYYKALDDFNKTFKERRIKEGFDDILTKNIAIIHAAEGVMDADQLAANKEYAEAKRWLALNTYKHIDNDLMSEIMAAFRELRSVNSFSKKFREFAKGKFDDEGIINGNLFTDGQVEQILARERTASSTREGDYDEKLIYNKLETPTGKLYQDAFYVAMRRNQTAADKTARNETIKAINAITSKYIDVDTRRIQTSDMEISELNELAALYDKLRSYDYELSHSTMQVERPDGTIMNVKKKTPGSKARIDFIKKNVTFEFNNDEFEYQKNVAISKGVAYYRAWANANQQLEVWHEEGAFPKVTPNTYLFSYMKPADKWIDLKKTQAAEFLDETVTFTPTKYYWARARFEATEGTYQDWFARNHTWDNTKNRYQPIRIWTNMEPVDKNRINLEPKAKWYENKIKDQYRNTNYEYGVTKVDGGSAYSSAKYNAIQADEGKKEVYDLLASTLDKYVVDPKAKDAINKGIVPYDAINTTPKDFSGKVNEIKRSLGWYDAATPSEIEEAYGRRYVSMPYLHRYNKTKEIPIRPKANDESAEDYTKYLKETHADNAKIREENNKAHLEHANPNYDEIFPTFVREAVRYNATRNNEYIMRATLEQLNAMQYHTFDSKGNILMNRTLGRVTGQEQARMSKGSNAAKHFEHTMNKLLYHEYEESAGMTAKIARVAKNLTSAKFMMLNMTGGINNVLYGESQVLIEAAGGQFFNMTDYGQGLWEYKNGIISAMSEIFNQDASSVTDAIVRRFNVVELDNISEIDNGGNVRSAYNKTIRLLYGQQAAGEHMMQNSTLLAMLRSHKLVKVGDHTEIMSRKEYSSHIRDVVFTDILKEYGTSIGKDLVGSYDKFKQSIREDPNARRRYVDYRRDMVTDYLNAMPLAIRRRFTERLQDTERHSDQEFAALPTFRSQFILKDGKAELREDSPLSNKEISEMRNKVIIVNHKIHGIYDKLGAAKFQSTAIGGIAFQFHKHIIGGWAKRWGYIFKKGVFNETRKEVDKGFYISTFDFLLTPFKKSFKLNEVTAEIEAIEGWRNVGVGYFNLLRYMRTNYAILPDYERINLRRQLAEIVSLIACMALFIAARLLDDDDKEETQAADFLLYNADRFASEIQQYTPLGAFQETKKLYKNPFAAMAMFESAGNMFSAITQYWFTGDKDALYYQSGSQYGQNKLSYNLQKQIPLWSQWLKYKRLGKNNSYYKVGNNVLGFLPLKDMIGSGGAVDNSRN